MRWILLVVVTLVAAAGCQTGPRVSRHIEMLNSEKRVLEDQLYELEYEYEDAIEELEQLRSENARLNQRLGTPIGPSSSSPRRSPPSKRSTSPNLDLTPPMVDEGSLSEPRIEIPDQPSTAPTPSIKPAPMAPGVPMSFMSPVDGTSEKAGEPGLLALVPPESTRPIHSLDPSGIERLPIDPTDPRITHIHLDPLLTGGSDFDRQPGDDGVIVALETRNQGKQFVPLAGPISVVLLDPTLDEQHARVARWDLEARDVEHAIRASNANPGIRLQLPWPNGAPQNNRLQLFVRYTTVDGRKLEASRDIFVTLPGQFSQRWTPRSSSRARVLTANVNGSRAAEAAISETAVAEKSSSQSVEQASHSESVEPSPESRSPSTSKWQPQR